MKTTRRKQRRIQPPVNKVEYLQATIGTFHPVPTNNVNDHL
jgi:hypothetical protein